MAEVTILYSLPLLVTVDTEEKTVTSVIEDYDNIIVVTGPLHGDRYGWRTVGDDQFAEQLDDDDSDMETAYEIAESESWPARES